MILLDTGVGQKIRLLLPVLLGIRLRLHRKKLRLRNPGCNTSSIIASIKESNRKATVNGDRNLGRYLTMISFFAVCQFNRKRFGLGNIDSVGNLFLVVGLKCQSMLNSVGNLFPSGGLR